MRSTKYNGLQKVLGISGLFLMAGLWAACSLIVADGKDNDPCGDGFCSPNENPFNCSQDCAEGVCGNHVCEYPDPVDGDCPADCGNLPYCHDGNCDGAETAQNCPHDCDGVPGCPNGVCDPLETETTCHDDCKLDDCPNGNCEMWENSVTCPQDCGASCGNDVAEDGEVCDGNDLRDETCMSLGRGGGVLGCTVNCTFNFAECETGADDGQPCALDFECAGGICLKGDVGGVDMGNGYCSGDCNGGTCFGGGECSTDGPANIEYGISMLCYDYCGHSNECRTAEGHECVEGTEFDFCWIDGMM